MEESRMLCRPCFAWRLEVWDWERAWEQEIVRQAEATTARGTRSALQEVRVWLCI